MSHAKTIARTIFYQLLVLFAGISIGFITNADWVGWKYPIVTSSFYNAFFPVEFEDEGEDIIDFTETNPFGTF